MYKLTANYKRTLKWFTALAFFFLGTVSSFAQKQDYVWLSGYGSEWHFYDSIQQTWYGTSVLDFNYNPRSIYYDSLKMNFSSTNTSYCDNNGNLIFYSNGVYIANSLDEKIDSSFCMNWGWFVETAYPDIQTDGYRVAQGIIALQNPANANQYYLLHTFIDGSPTVVPYFRSTLVTLLDMSLNGGHGAVIYKNQTLIDNNLGAELSACRHANGRDWWLLVSKRFSNCYYRILVDPTGVHVLNDSLSCGGDSIPDETHSSSVFSPDGSKYAYYSIREGVNIFDFDRCNGELSNVKNIHLPDLWWDGWINTGLSISPSNQYLYVAHDTMVEQYDLFALNIASSKVAVAINDGNRAPFGSAFHTMQIAPDGKIYESCGNTEYVLHVIEHPDEKGDSCLFIQHGVRLPSYCGGVPNFPNYRLGKLAGSLCDTLTGLSESARAEKEKILKVFPNPAGNMVTVDYGFTDWSKPGDVKLVMSDELGRVVLEQLLPKYSGFQNINVSTLAAGTYFVYLKRNGNTIAGEKMMKE